MTTQHYSSLRATMALAAVLALGSTPAWAQSAPSADAAAPAAQLPPSEPAPTIVLPTAPAPSLQSTPVIEPTRSTAPSPVAEQTPARTARTAPRPAPVARHAAAHPAAAAIPAAAEKAPSEKAGAEKPVAAPAPAAAAAAAIAQDNPTPGRSTSPVSVSPSGPSMVPASPSSTHATVRPANNSSETEWEIGLAALVGIGVIGGIGMMAANVRRRRDVEVSEQAAFEDATLAQEAIAPQWPTMVQPAAPVQAAEPMRSFTMPAGPVPNGDAREALIADMVAAEPDEENPFSTRKARRRRARTILTQRELDLGREATRPFDWRTYEQVTEDLGLDKTPATAST